MKKTLTALAVLGAFAGTAVAADITLYGKIDAGLNYVKDKTRLVNHGAGGTTVTNTDKDTFGMKTGQNSASRFGIKGTEDLGNGMTVGFILENGFDSDTGEFSQKDRLFGREANLFLKGSFGELSFGRVGALTSGTGSYSKIYNYSAFGTSWGSYAAPKSIFGLARDRMDNTMTYVSPEFAGAQIYAQYSFQTADAEKPDSGANDRYAGLGVTYNLGAFSTGLVVDSVMPSNLDVEGETRNTENSLGVSLGASYDFGFMKVMGLAQYGKNETSLVTVDINDYATGAKYFEGMDGYALHLGATAPIAGGTFYAQVSYADAEEADPVAGSIKDGSHTYTYDNAAVDAKAWGLAMAYEYPLSARTKVYGFAAYNKVDLDTSASGSRGDQNFFQIDEAERKITEVGFGMVHSF